MKIITQQADLLAYCNNATKQKAIAVDTEFVRTRTLYPCLGLVQLNDGAEVALVDPLALNDLSPLAQLMTNPDVIKVMHSCSEDMEAFWKSLGVLPAPVFDTQFAAGLLNMGSALGYARLVQQQLGIELDKGESRTDWLARPLTEQQLEYAANDVIYLMKVFPELYEAIKDQQRLNWVYQESARVGIKRQTELPAEFGYLTIKNNWQLDSAALVCLKNLAQWRLNRARSKNRALNFVIREPNLLAMAEKQPLSKTALGNIQGISANEVRRFGDEWIQLIQDALAIPLERRPVPVKRLVDCPGYKKTVQGLKRHCQSVAQQQNIPVELIGSKKQLNQLLKWLWFDIEECKIVGQKPDVLTGWRAELLQKGFETVLGRSLEQNASA